MPDTPTSAKGYWIARLNVEDDAAYGRYRALNSIAFAKFGGRFLVRGGPYLLAKGHGRQHNVVIEFPSGEAARACYHSPEYQAALKELVDAGPTDMIVIDGYAGQQPGEA